MSHDAPVETEVLRDHMKVVEFLAENSEPDGTRRDPGRLTITTSGTVWVAEVLDVHQARFFQVVALSLDGLLALLNAILASGAPPWRSTSRRR